MLDIEDSHNEQCNDLVAFLKTTALHDVLRSQACHMLELGCGMGSSGRRLLAEYPLLRVTGVEITADRYDKLRQYIRDERIEARYVPLRNDILKADLFAARSFDLVLAPMVLHHFPKLDQSGVPANIRTWLKPQGHLIVFDPNGANPMLKFSNQLVLRCLLPICKSAAALKCSDETMFTPAFYRKLFAKHGFSLKQGKTFGSFVPLRNDANSLMLRWMVSIRNALCNAIAPVTFGDWHGHVQIAHFQKDA